MLKKIFKFIAGYVIIEVVGKNKERFVSMCLKNKMKIWSVLPCEKGLRLELLRSDFLRIRRLVRKSGVRVCVKSKHGLKEWRRCYGGRIGFFVSAAAVCIFFLIIPHYIWCVEIDGLYYADRDKIMEILKDNGVYVGARKSAVTDLGDIKSEIVYRVDGVNWAWLYIEGAKARLQIQEVKLPPEIADNTEPADIIAVRDGFIIRSDVARGEKRVSMGDTVSAGDTLVSGKVGVFREGYPEKYIYVHSQADIQAKTVRTERGKFSKTETLRVPTGKIKRRFVLSGFGKSISLYRDKSCGFEEYATRDTKRELSLPVIGDTGLAFTIRTVSEVYETERELSTNEVLERAQETLEERICKELGTGAVRLSEELTYSADNGQYDVELRMHLRENIGITIPIEE